MNPTNVGEGRTTRKGFPATNRPPRLPVGPESPQRPAAHAGPAPSDTPGASRLQGALAGFTLAAIGLHLLLRWGVRPTAAVGIFAVQDWPLIAALVVGGIPLVAGLLVKVAQRQFGSDLLAGIAIVTAVVLGEYLAGSLVVLMLSGGEALEAYAVRRASSVLEALARRLPSVAYRERDGG